MVRKLKIKNTLTDQFGNSGYKGGSNFSRSLLSTDTNSPPGKTLGHQITASTSIQLFDHGVIIHANVVMYNQFKSFMVQHLN